MVMPRGPSTSLHSAQDDLSAKMMSHIRLCLRQADQLLAVLPLAAFLEKLDALEAFQHIALSRNRAGPF